MKALNRIREKNLRDILVKIIDKTQWLKQTKLKLFFIFPSKFLEIIA